LKLSKTSWLILSVGIFLVVLAGLGLTRSQQLQEQGQLGEELSIAEMRLSKFQVSELRQQQEELQRQLDENTVQLTAAKDILSQTVESISVTDEFFQIAQFCDVTVMSISSSGIESGKLEDIACSVITLNTAVEGEVSNLINFVIRLNTDFTTGVVKSAQISINEADGEGDEGESSASILVVVHAYEGD
jgi:hypothetical protein